MKKQECKDCRYCNKDKFKAFKNSRALDGYAHCLRFPPIVLSLTRNRVTSQFTIIALTDWCGEWEMNDEWSK